MLVYLWLKHNTLCFKSFSNYWMAEWTDTCYKALLKYHPITSINILYYYI